MSTHDVSLDTPLPYDTFEILFKRFHAKLIGRSGYWYCRDNGQVYYHSNVAVTDTKYEDRYVRDLYNHYRANANNISVGGCFSVRFV